jgi:hypothetical protein
VEPVRSHLRRYRAISLEHDLTELTGCTSGDCSGPRRVS